MTIRVQQQIRKALPLLLAEKEVTDWQEVVALEVCASEIRALLKDAKERIDPPKPHGGPHSGKKVRPHNALREEAAAMLNSAYDNIFLMGQSLSNMTVFGLEKIAASASETAAIASALLEKIGVVQDKTILVKEAITERQILRVVSSVTGNKTKEYRDLATKTS